jgi:hypothetical protein
MRFSKPSFRIPGRLGSLIVLILLTLQAHSQMEAQTITIDTSPAGQRQFGQ